MADELVTIQSAIKEGDQKAFAGLHHLYYQRLCLFAGSITRSREAAEEIVEDVFVQLWSHRHTITDIENLTVYLYVSVKNRSLNTLAKKARELVVAPFEFLDIDVRATAPDPQQLMITQEMMAKMQEAINALPPRCKMIFKLAKEDGLRYKEIGQILNISVNTIDAQMSIAISRICKALELKEKPTRRFRLPFSKK